MASPFISVIIPTLNREISLRRTLECLRLSAFRDFEVLVVNQGGAEAGLAAGWEGPALRIIPLPRPNLPLARNTGVLNAAGQLVLFLDDDVTFSPMFLDAHRLAHEAHPEAAAVAGRIRLAAPHFYEEKECIAAVDAKTAKFKVNYDCGREAFIDFFSGGNTSFKQEALRRTGPFDTRFSGNALYEEIDYSLRLTKAGGRIFFSPQAELTHLREESGGCRSETGSRYHVSKFFNTGYFYGKQLFSGNPLPFLKAQKNEIEFYTRQNPGHHWGRAALYFASVFRGMVCGIVNRL